MYTIGICDDDEAFCWETEKHIIKYCRSIHMKMETYIFTSGNDLSRFLQSGSPMDLLFLDIKLPDTSGIDIARTIRRKLENENLQIVFISGKKDYALHLFDARPLDFLVKPISYEKISHIMDTYCRLYAATKRYLEFSIHKQTHRLDQRCILYLQSDAKIITLYTCTGKYQFYGKLSEYFPQLDSTLFVWVHKSFIINTNHVMEYHASSLVMIDGAHIPISKTRRKMVKEYIMSNEVQKR